MGGRMCEGDGREMKESILRFEGASGDVAIAPQDGRPMRERHAAHLTPVLSGDRCLPVGMNPVVGGFTDYSAHVIISINLLLFIKMSFIHVQ